MTRATAGALAEALRGRVCVLGLGNRDRGDDAAGPLLVDRLRGRVPAPCLDAGVAPENCLEQVVRERPDVVLLVDAADFGGMPGEVRLADPAEHRPGTLSTHAPSLDLVARYLRVRAGCVVRVLAIQAAVTRPGRPLSEAVRATLEGLADRLAAVLSGGGPGPCPPGAPPLQSGG
jgi:hydrogenase 3 maturation protease